MKPLLLIHTDSSISYYFYSPHELMLYLYFTHATTYYERQYLTVPYYLDTNNMLLNRTDIISHLLRIILSNNTTFTGNNNSYYYSPKPYNSLNIPLAKQPPLPYLFYYYSSYFGNIFVWSLSTRYYFCMVSHSTILFLYYSLPYLVYYNFTNPLRG